MATTKKTRPDKILFSGRHVKLIHKAGHSYYSNSMTGNTWPQSEVVLVDLQYPREDWHSPLPRAVRTSFRRQGRVLKADLQALIDSASALDKDYEQITAAERARVAAEQSAKEAEAAAEHAAHKQRQRYADAGPDLVNALRGLLQGGPDAADAARAAITKATEDV